MQPRAQFCSLLAGAVQPFLKLTSLQLASCWQHYELLAKWNQVISLTTIVTMEEAVQRHYAESFFLAAHLPREKCSIADLGSGPGFPGFPCALIHSSSSVALIESVGKKSAFLRESAHLPNLTVYGCRAEQVREDFDWIISRAVSPADVIAWAEEKRAKVAMLIGREDAGKLHGFSVIDLPWGENRVLAISQVPRETP